MDSVKNHFQEFLGITDLPVRSAISTIEPRENLYDITHLIKQRGYVPVVSKRFDRGIIIGLCISAAILAVAIISAQVIMAVAK